jgi:PIN domain nuclease of toxin-antitoxin system
VSAETHLHQEIGVFCSYTHDELTRIKGYRTQVDNEIARISVQLPKDLPEDPPDRLIVASAISLGATLITKDAKIRGTSAVQTLW